MNVLTTALLLVTLQYCHALSPTNCDASEPSAERVLDLINKGRRNGYAFELLRVADAHLDRVGNATVYYLVLDVKESDCWVLSTKSRDACLLDVSRRPSEIVIGQCKVIATRYSDESQDFRVNNYNCTTSSVSSALSNTKDSPVLLDFFEDSEPYREQANTALDKYKWENSDFGSFRVERIERVIRAGEVSQEIDCNDEDVFLAVDVALKKYNAGNQSGNQFMLYRVTEGTKMVGSETFYSFKYQIKEGNCSVQSGLTWQDCDFRDAEEAATGECTATVRKRGTKKFSLATQTCKITPGNGPIVTAEYTCLGCVHPISTDNPELQPVLKHAIEHFNNNTEHSHFFALEEVKAAQRQDAGECRDSAFVDIKQKIVQFSQNCDLYSGEDLEQPLPEDCLGCPKKIPVDSPELTEPLGHAITKLNTDNSHSFYFKIDTVKKATSQVVGGMKYFIEFIARETECSKESNTELTANCEVKPIGQSLNCKANVYMRPWENKVQPTVNCRALETVQPLPENCPGCPKNIPVDSPELTEPLGHAITKLNTDNSHSFYFKIDTVKKATSQVCKHLETWEVVAYA
ncbi:Kininogen-1 [Cricetulus griseus]|uniref:Kininogen-1 n=1 Tax=Cricetulus griseus TaxID=10029 RepID=G3HYG4_CRIGR|nr:Kininogen-1 [Cricetulus griseus]